MKNVAYILKRDIKRILSSWVAIMVILGICVLPSLYAWFNVAANIDPYKNTANIKIAVACQDKGVHDKVIGNVNVGDKIVEELGKNNKLDWVFMDEEEAIGGAKAGDYYAAIIIPEDFSAKLTGVIHGKVEKPVIDYYVNEKLNAIAPKVTDTGSQTLQDTVDTKFKEAVSTVIMKTLAKTSHELTEDLSDENANLINSIKDARSAIAQYQKAIDDFQSMYPGSKSLAGHSKKLAKAISSALRDMESIIATNESEIDTAKQDTEEAIETIKQFQEDFPDIAHPITDEILAGLTDFDENLKSVDEALNKTSGLIAAVDPTTDLAVGMLSNLSEGLDSTDSALSSMSNALESTDALLADAHVALLSLQSAEVVKDLKEISGMDYKTMAKFMASPIELDTEKLYPVKNYGSGVAPFFTMLAIWVGGLVLIAIFKYEVEVDPEEKRYITMTEAYFGRSLLFTFFGLIQAAIVCIGDIYLLGIQCLHPWAFLLTGLVASIVFVNLIFALTITFRHIGKALAVLLVILQIPGSSGTYPVELTGSFFQKLYPFLPFSYGVRSLRECIGGFYGSYYLTGILGLLAFLLVAFFIGLVLRPLIVSINHTFDTRLNATGILSSENNARERENRAIKAALRFVYSNDDYQEAFEKRIEAFERFHQKVEDKGFKFIFIIPIVLLIMVFVFPMKPLMITIWVVGILAVVLFLIMVEHTHVMIKERKYVEEVSADEKRDSDI